MKNSNFISNIKRSIREKIEERKFLKELRSALGEGGRTIDLTHKIVDPYIPSAKKTLSDPEVFGDPNDPDQKSYTLRQIQSIKVPYVDCLTHLTWALAQCFSSAKECYMLGDPLKSPEERVKELAISLFASTLEAEGITDTAKKTPNKKAEILSGSPFEQATEIATRCVERMIALETQRESGRKGRDI